MWAEAARVAEKRVGAGDGGAMQSQEFLAKVRDRGEYADQAESEQVTRAVLLVLAERLAAGDAEDVASQLPDGLRDALRWTDAPERSVGVEEFVERVAAALGTGSAETARWDASAVLTTLAEALEDALLSQVLTRLPAGYALLFGKPERAR